MPILSVQVRNIPETAVMGAKYFVVAPSDIKTVKANCPVCDGTQKITYKGYEMCCSYCQKDDVERHFIYKYSAEEYIVNEITIKGPDRKNAWTPMAQLEERNLPFITYVAASSGKNKRSIVLWEEYIDPDEATIRATHNISEYVFTSRALANKAIKILVEREKAKLADFNAKFNCNYEYPSEEK